MQVRLLRLLLFLAGFLLFAYVATRAYFLSLTHDEGLTFMHFMFAPVKDIITYDYPNANNHLLNTLSMRLVSAILPLEDHWLRLPNVLGYLIYLIFSWKITSDFTNKYWRAGAWLFLNSVPYLLDFFSLARGYGLSMSFMMGSLYFFKEFLEAGRHRALLWCLAAAALAVLSNIVLLNYFLALCTVLFANAILAKQPKGYNVRSLEIFFAVSLPLLAYTLYVAFRMRAAGELFFGSRYGFWDGSVRSLITRVLYKDTIGAGLKYYVEGLPYILGSAFIILILGLSVFFLLKKWSRGAVSICFFQGVFIIVLLCAASIFLQYYILGTLFVLDRTALFFIPLFLLLIIALFQRHLWQYLFARAAFGCIAGFSILNFFSHANFTHCLEWKYDASTETMMKDLRKYHKEKREPETKRLFPFWTYHPASAFYQASDDYTFLKPIERYFKLDYTYDYYYLPDDEMRRFEGKPIKIIRKYPLTQSTLFENPEPEKKVVYARGRLSFDPKDSALGNTVFSDTLVHHGKLSKKIEGSAFGPTIPLSVYGLPRHKPLRIEMEAEIFCDQKPIGNLAISVVTPNDSQYHWSSGELVHISIAPGRWTRVSYNLVLPDFLSEKDTIKVYLWNTGNTPIYLSRMEAIVVDKVE